MSSNSEDENEDDDGERVIDHDDDDDNCCEGDPADFDELTPSELEELQGDILKAIENFD